MIKDIEFLFKKILFSERYLLKKRLKRAISKDYEKELKIIDKFGDKSKDALDLSANLSIIFSSFSYPFLIALFNLFFNK